MDARSAETSYCDECDGESVERPTPKNRVSKSISSRVVFAKNEKEWSEFNSQTIPELTTWRRFRIRFWRVLREIATIIDVFMAKSEVWGWWTCLQYRAITAWSSRLRFCETFGVLLSIRAGDRHRFSIGTGFSKQYGKCSKSYTSYVCIYKTVLISFFARELLSFFRKDLEIILFFVKLTPFARHDLTETNNQLGSYQQHTDRKCPLLIGLV